MILALAVLVGLWLLGFVLTVAWVVARERLLRREARAAGREFEKLTGDRR